MLKQLFSGKPDHPMADLKEARRILDQLPAQDYFKSIEELTHWLDSVGSAEGFRPEPRLQILLLIDEAAQPRLRKLAKDYLAAERPSRFQENRLWSALHGYWRQAGLTFARAVDQFVQGAKGVESAKASLPLLLVRTLRCLAQQIKWMHMRYGPIDTSIWKVLHGVYAYAEIRQLAQAKVVVYPGTAGDSTPQLEFLRGVMFSASSPDSLLPAEADLAERLIAEFSPRFTLAQAPAPGQTNWTDLAKAMVPARISRTLPSGPGLRCFGAGSTLADLNELIERVYSSGAVPSNASLAGCAPEMVLQVLRHLARVWSPQPTERKAQRHSVKSRLSVVNGYDGVLGALGGGDSLDFDVQGSESWIVENVSAGGFGAVVPQLKGDWLRVGELVALQPEGGDNWLLGLVRRVNKLGPQQARVGIETLSRTPEVARFAVAGTAGAAEQGVLLKGAEGAESRILLKPGIYAPMQNLEVQRGGRQHVYIPQGFAERGEDYEIARFREMIRES